jgi:preprotein translocase subunit SecA
MLAYDERETEYPVMAGLYHFTTQDAGSKVGRPRPAGGLGPQRFDVDLSPTTWNRQRTEIHDMLSSQPAQERANAALAEACDGRRRSSGARRNGHDRRAQRRARAAGRLDAASRKWTLLGPCSAQPRVPNASSKWRSKIATGPNAAHGRSLVLQILDTAWKDHLLAMDHLRASVGLRGYAQVDPKVEYKREGMRTFELMWSSVAERVTDLIFRIEDRRIVRVALCRGRGDSRRGAPSLGHRRPAAGSHRRHSGRPQARADPQSQRESRPQ